MGISDNLILRDIRDSQITPLCQRVITADHHGPVPLIARQHNQIVIQMQGFCRDGKIAVAFADILGYLCRRALVHMQGNVRVTLNKAFNHRRQCITCLGMGCGDTQGSLLRIRVLTGDSLDGINFRQHFTGDTDNGFPGRCHMGQMFTAAGKNLHSQLIFQHPDLLTDTGL